MNDTKSTAPALHVWDDNGWCQPHGGYCSMAAREPEQAERNTAERDVRRALVDRIEKGELSEVERVRLAWLVRTIASCVEDAPSEDETFRRIEVAAYWNVIHEEYRKLVPEAGAR